MKCEWEGEVWHVECVMKRHFTLHISHFTFLTGLSESCRGIFFDNKATRCALSRQQRKEIAMRNVSKILSVLTLGAAMVCVSGTAFAADGDKPVKSREAQRERARDRDGEAKEKAGDKEAGEGQRRQRPQPGERGERMMQVLEELNLTDAQKEQIKEIRMNNREKREKLMQEIKDLPPEERQAKMGEFMKQVRGQIEGVLTDDQKTTLKEKLAERPRDGEGPRGRGPRDGEGRNKEKGPRDGDAGEKEKGPRDGDQPRKGPRDGERPRKGPRDGDKADN